jgi:hypothetical protein
MKTTLSRRTIATGVGVSLAAVLLSGTAYAYWTAHAAGTGSNAAASGLTSFTTTATVAQGALLYPGGSAPLIVNVNNSGNGYSLVVNAVALDSGRAIGVDSSHAAGCTNPAISVTTPSGWTGIAVAQHSSSGAVSIPAAVSMGTAASSGCQGATFTIPVTLTGRSS